MKARELGVAIGSLEPGPLDAITDVEGVRVGHTTLIEGDAVRTGVTVVLLPEEPLFAAPFRLNGNGEMTGLEWVRESGLLTTPIGLTNTHSVGVVRDALVRVAVAREDAPDWSPPRRGRDLGRLPQRHQRLPRARRARVRCRRGGVRRRCRGGQRRRRHRNDLPRLQGRDRHRVAGGRGRAYRRRARAGEPRPAFTAGHGRRAGRRRTRRRADPSAGSARRRRLVGEDSSGDLLLAFATGNREVGGDEPTTVSLLPGPRMNALFVAAVEATEAAILNALLAAETMTGCKGRTAHALDPETLVAVMKRYGRA